MKVNNYKSWNNIFKMALEEIQSFPSIARVSNSKRNLLLR
jgi:hypothetical protein